MSGHHGGGSGASPGREPRRGLGWERWEDDRYHEDATTDPTHTSDLRPTLSGEELRRAGREGSVGSVYLGTMRSTGLPVAVKSVRDDLTENTRTVNRTVEDIITEVSVMASIGSHPSIVSFVGACVPEGGGASIPTVVLEYLDGGSIVDTFEQRRRDSKGWRPPKRISFKWLHDLLRAMAFLHGRDQPLIHRDIKPSNMFCSADLSNLKLGDFGLCRPVKAADDDRCMTAMAGSFTHMAPEVFNGNAEYSTKADIFSAAISTVFLITGEEPYSQDPEVFSDGHYAIACRVCKQGYRMPLSSIKYPPMAALLSSMWHHSPRERPCAKEAADKVQDMLIATVENSNKPLAWISRKTGISVAKAGKPGTQDDAKTSTRPAQGWRQSGSFTKSAPYLSNFVVEVSSRGHVEPGSDRAGVDAGTTNSSKKGGLIRKFTQAMSFRNRSSEVQNGEGQSPVTSVADASQGSLTGPTGRPSVDSSQSSLAGPAGCTTDGPSVGTPGVG